MKVLVFGFYNHNNLGDDLFVRAFQYIFPNINFIFSEVITTDLLQNVDAVFIGGGSFLSDTPNIDMPAWQMLQGKKIFYLGIGVEADIHPIHVDLMARALLIATRSPDQVSRLQKINLNTRFLPDLVYALQSKVKLAKKVPRSVLIMPNIVVVPKRSDPHWKHAAWTYFKSEFCQFIDWLINNNYYPNFFSMCHSAEMDDDWAVAEIISHMDKSNNKLMFNKHPFNIETATLFLSKYEIIITQRFHGIVLAEMMRTPYIAIHHHDKLKLVSPNDGIFVSYYNSSKQSLIDAFNQARAMNYSSVLPIIPDIFIEISDDIKNLL